MSAPLSVADAFKARHSVRVFTDPLSPGRKSIVVRAIADAQQIPTPFNTTVEIADHPAGLGSLNLISKEGGWVLAKVPAGFEPNHLVDVAYRLQHVVVRLVQHRFGTVWIAETFQRSVAEQENPGFKVPVAIAYGEDPHTEPYLLERFVKWTIGASTRYPFEHMFFSMKRNAPIKEEEAGRFHGILQAVRLGPSVKNAQPWRVIVDEEAAPAVVNVFLVLEKNMQFLDIGIALGAIAVTVAAEGKMVQFSVPETAPAPSPLRGKFIISALVP
jgi:nitroreductase